MTGPWRRPVGVVLALLVAAGTGAGQAGALAATQSEAGAYVGNHYSTGLASTPTRTENESKLWFAAGAWWALMLDPKRPTERVYELMPDHTWRPTTAVVNEDVLDIGDSLHEGDTVHVLTRRKDGSLVDLLLTFDATTRDYRVGPPHLVANRGSASPAAIRRDTTGRLWVAFATSTAVFVSSSTDDGTTWTPVYQLATTGGGLTPEAAALVPFDDRIGVLWSDHRTGSFEFASHRDADPLTSWTREQAMSGDGDADNHISLAAIDGSPTDTLVAAVKTSRNDDASSPVTTPLIDVLVRRPGGQWSVEPFSTIGDGLNNPVLQVDTVNGTLHVIAAGHGGIVAKRAPLDDIHFAPGLGDLLLSGGQGSLTDPAVSKDPLDARSGIVVLASDPENRTYRHAEVPLARATAVIDPDDTVPPSRPAHVLGSVTSTGRVVLSWAPSNDGEQWLPGREGVPVRGYVVRRDGVRLARVESTSFVDRLDGVRAGTSVRYDVQAVDLAGNSSAVAHTAVTVPAPEDTRRLALIAGGLFLVALAAAGVPFWRRRHHRSLLVDDPDRSRLASARGTAGPARS